MEAASLEEVFFKVLSVDTLLSQTSVCMPKDQKEKMNTSVCSFLSSLK